MTQELHSYVYAQEKWKHMSTKNRYINVHINNHDNS